MTDTLSTLLIVGVASICTAAVRFLPSSSSEGIKRYPQRYSISAKFFRLQLLPR